MFRKLEKKYGVKVSNFTACGILGSSGLILLALAWQVGGPSHNVDDRAAGPSDAARLDFRSEHFDAKQALRTPGLVTPLHGGWARVCENARGATFRCPTTLSGCCSGRQSIQGAFFILVIRHLPTSCRAGLGWIDAQARVFLPSDDPSACATIRLGAHHKPKAVSESAGAKSRRTCQNCAGFSACLVCGEYACGALYESLGIVGVVRAQLLGAGGMAVAGAQNKSKALTGKDILQSIAAPLRDGPYSVLFRCFVERCFVRIVIRRINRLGFAPLGVCVLACDPRALTPPTASAECAPDSSRCERTRA